jgi:hypothetical protein
LPAGTDIRSRASAPQVGYFQDWVAIPTGAVPVFFVSSVYDVAAGYPNEYRLAVILRDASSTTFPIPRL